MTDARVDWIVARLRLEATYAAAEAIDGPVPVERIVYWQAADEIERLTKEAGTKPVAWLLEDEDGHTRAVTSEALADIHRKGGYRMTPLVPAARHP